MEEFVTSETEYVSNLDHVIRGYLEKCEGVPDLFPPDLRNSIFGNIREIYYSQRYPIKKEHFWRPFLKTAFKSYFKKSFSMFGNTNNSHARILRRIKRAVYQNSVAAIGRMFLTNQKSFNVYRDYCSNFDAANRRLNQLLSDKNYTSFFNSCRTEDKRYIF